MTAKEILKVIEESGKNYTMFGVRADNREFEIGDELPCSHNMIDDLYDEETGMYPLLDGTCAIGFGQLWFDGEDDDIETVNAALEACHKYCTDRMYLVVGSGYQYGDDAGEIVIENAVVVAEI